MFEHTGCGIFVEKVEKKKIIRSWVYKITFFVGTYERMNFSEQLLADLFRTSPKIFPFKNFFSREGEGVG